MCVQKLQARDCGAMGCGRVMDILMLSDGGTTFITCICVNSTLVLTLKVGVLLYHNILRVGIALN